MSDRLARLRDRMAETGTDLVVLGPSSHMQWLLGLNPHGDERPVMALVSAGHIGVLMPRLNAASCRQQTDVPFFEWSDDEGPDAALAALIAASGVQGQGRHVVLDETMRADFALLLLGALDAPKHRFTEDTIGALRASKDDAEYAKLKACAQLNDRAFQLAFDSLREGMTELDVQSIIADFYAENGASVAFCIVAFGANGAFPHHHTGGTRLERDMAVLIDSGCRLDGYPSDMTRCGWFGAPTEDFLSVAGIVNEAVEAAMTAARVGQPASAVDQAARSVIADAGYGAAFSHRTGHGMGIDVHEPPYITATSEAPLVQGNVFSIEPGIYLDGQFGIRLEETVILREDGPEILAEFPRDIVVKS